LFIAVRKERRVAGVKERAYGACGTRCGRGEAAFNGGQMDGLDDKRNETR